MFSALARAASYLVRIPIPRETTLRARMSFWTAPLRERRWLLTQTDLTMTLACRDWPAQSSERRYEVPARWAGQALLGESATRDYGPSSNALAMYTAIWSLVT